MNSIIDNQLDHARPKPIIITQKQRLIFEARIQKVRAYKLGQWHWHEVLSDLLKKYGA